MTPLSIHGDPVTDDADRTLSALAVLILSELGESHYRSSAEPLHAFFRFEPAEHMRQYHYLYAVISSLFDAARALILTCNLRHDGEAVCLGLAFSGPELVEALGEVPPTSLCFDLTVLSKTAARDFPAPDTLDLRRSRIVLRPWHSEDTDEARTPRQVCFSPDGRHLAVVSMDGAVVVYGCPSFHEMWSSNQCYGSRVWFSEDGRWLHGTDESSWAVETGAEVPGGVLDVDRSARGTWALQSEPDGLTIQPMLGAVVQAASWSYGRPHAAMLSAGGQRLALLHRQPLLTIYDTAGQTLLHVHDLPARCSSVSLSPGGRWVAAAGSRVWPGVCILRASDGEVVFRREDDDEADINFFSAFSPDGRWFALSRGAEVPSLTLYPCDPDTGRPDMNAPVWSVQPLAGLAEGLEAGPLVFRHDSSAVIMSEDFCDPYCLAYAVSDGARSPGSPVTVPGLHAISVSEEAEPVIRRGSHPTTLSPPARITALATTPDERVLLIGGDWSGVLLCDLELASMIGTIETGQPTDALSVSPDGTLVCLAMRSAIEIRQVTDGAVVWTHPWRTEHALQWSPDGRQAALIHPGGGDHGGWVSIYDLSGARRGSRSSS